MIFVGKALSLSGSVRLLIAKLLMASFSCLLPSIYGATAVFDFKKFLVQGNLNAVQKSIADRMEVLSKLDSDRSDAQKKISDQMGPTSHVTLAPLASPTQISGLKDHAVVRDIASSANPTDQRLASYQKWDENRRISEAAMDEQLTALLRSSDGARLDWTGHSKLANSLQALTNDRIASSIANANAASESKLDEKRRASELLKIEQAAEQRKAVEDRLFAK